MFGRTKRVLAVILLTGVAAIPACLSPKRDQPTEPAATSDAPDRSHDALSDPTVQPEEVPQQRPAPVIMVRAQPTAEPLATHAPRTSETHPPPILRLAGQEFLALTAAKVVAGGKAYACRIVPEQTSSQPAVNHGDNDSDSAFNGESHVDHKTDFVSFRLVPEDPRQPVCRCEVRQLEVETVIKLYAPGRPARVELIAETLTPMLPVCLNPRDTDRLLNAALGPVSGAWFDGLFLPERDWAVAFEGTVHCEELPDRVRLTLSSHTLADNGPAMPLTLRSEPSFLKTRHNLAGYAPLNRRRPELMPAAWMPLETPRPPTAEEIARNTVWMAINLQPYGAASVLLPGMQGMLPAVRTAATPTGASAGTGPANPVQAGPSSGWDWVQQMGSSIVTRFWGHGLLAQSMSSTLFVGEPLTYQQARLSASLVGLAGESPIACEQMYTLPEERTELLRRIIPAAQVRAIDLFAHRGLPPVWNLTVTNGAGRSNILGLFNISDEPRIESVELADLHLGTGVEQFAVYDFWERRLLRIVRDRFQLQVPATGCRVVSIHQLAEGQPTIIGTNRHLTCGGIDLHDIRWNDENATLSGQSDVVANDPYELLLYLPESPRSVELLAIESKAAVMRSRAHGPLRVITFENTASGPLDWKVRFHRVSSPPQSPPPRPRSLAARQNTRGVHLSWFQPDDRVVAHRVYRDRHFLAEVDGCEYQDITALYSAEYEYAVTAVNFCGQESMISEPLIHHTPTPASTNLTQLMPLSVSQGQLSLGRDRNAKGAALRMGGQRIYRGLGTTAPSRIVYFLGGGYEAFSGLVGIDNIAGAKGSAVFRIIADGQTLFTSPVMKGGKPPLPFNVRVEGKLHLELVVTDAGDGSQSDYADWGNPYLRAGQNAGVTETPPLGNPPGADPDLDEPGWFPDAPASQPSATQPGD